MVPRVLYRISIGQTRTFHDELRVYVQELFSDWFGKLQEESGT